MSRVAERQRFIRYWQETSGETEIDLHKVAQLAMKMGWAPPPPISAEDRLAQQFKDAAKQDIRHDRKTGRPYRGYHAVPRPASEDGQLQFFYVDIDEPKTKPEHFRKACVMRREQTVDDLLALFNDQTHWNETRPPEQHVEMLPADLGPDIEWRLASEDEEPKAAQGLLPASLSGERRDLATLARRQHLGPCRAPAEAALPSTFHRWQSRYPS